MVNGFTYASKDVNFKDKNQCTPMHYNVPFKNMNFL